MKFDLTRTDGMFILNCPELGIIISGAELQKVFDELTEDIKFIFLEYGQAIPDNMTLDAVVLRDNIRQLMGVE